MSLILKQSWFHSQHPPTQLLLHLRHYPIKRPVGVTFLERHDLWSLASGIPPLLWGAPEYRACLMPVCIHTPAKACARGHDGYGMRSAACHYLHVRDRDHIIFRHAGRMSVHKLSWRLYSSNCSSSNCIRFNLVQSTSKQCWNYKTTYGG